MADPAGVVHGLHVLYPDREWPTFPFTHLRIWDCDLYWRDIHVAPDTFRFDRMDRIVQQARAGGVRNLTYCLAMTPGWAASKVPTNHAPWLNPGCNSAPADMRHWDAFVTQMVTRYRGLIGSWQVWNEPQLKWFWDEPMLTLAELTVRAHRIIKRIDPKAKVIAAPVLPTSGDWGMRYYAALRSKGWPVDIYAAHIYPRAGWPVSTWGSMVRSAQRNLVDARAPRGPLWITETNANHGHGPLPPATQRAWMGAVDKQAAALGIPRVYWYGYGSHSDTSLLGIPLREATPGSRWIARHQ